MTTRRIFLLGLGAGAFGARLAFAAEPPAGSRRLGWLEPGGPDTFPGRTKAFLEVLAGQGYAQGRNLVFDARYASGKIDTLPVLAAELVALKPDCILAIGVDAVHALKRTTSTIPIVIGNIDADPVKEGFAASLARPGGNITGFAGIAWELAGKRLELLRELAPGVSRIGVVFDPRSPAAHAHLKEAAIAAAKLKMELLPIGLTSADEVEDAIRAARKKRIDALFVVAVGMINSHRRRIAALAAETRLPAMYSNIEFVADGGLVGYAPNLMDQIRRAALYVDRILRGARPAELPIEQARYFELAVNLRAAKQIGLAVPKSFLARADRVIE